MTDDQALRLDELDPNLLGTVVAELRPNRQRRIARKMNKLSDKQFAVFLALPPAQQATLILEPLGELRDALGKHKHE